MFKHCMEIVHNHGNGYRDWLFDSAQLSKCVKFETVWEVLTEQMA